MKHLDTEFLIVGCGPAGASLACFLGSYGLTGIAISADSGTADTPRAHITNMAAMECLRDIGLDRDVDRVASRHGCMEHTRWCQSMAGAELARVYSWGHDPQRMGDYERASPCKPADVPQTLLEPVLVQYAVHNGFRIRFDTKLLSLTVDDDDDNDIITATVRDELSHTEYKIRTRYLFGADGARSLVVRELGFPLRRKPGQGPAYNVLVKADMSHLIGSRMGNLHWVIRPGDDDAVFTPMAIVRMVRLWDEWLFILFARDNDAPAPSAEQYRDRVRKLIGDDTPAEIVGTSKWQINDVVAETYSKGNVFCLGDAVHRHPPMNGLGSNTCIQDAYNLAWKLALVHRGKADRSLLDTYQVERQPVGSAVVARANRAFQDHFTLWDALGTNTSPDSKRAFEELTEVSPAGQKRRQDFRRGVEQTTAEFHGLGIEMGQHYRSKAVYDADEPEPWKPTGRAAEDPVLYYEPSTYPGSRLPHVWLNKACPTQPVSTIDVAGHGRFVLLTGIGGEAWKEAARRVSASLEVKIDAYSIGFRQDWEDVYFDWERLRGVSESGAVLVRPDRPVMLISLTVGKVDAGVTVLLTPDKRLIEFPSILLPPNISSGSIVDITVSQNTSKESAEEDKFRALQDRIYNSFGASEPATPALRCRNATQTSVVLEWDPVQLATADLISLSLYRNGQKAGNIPRPLAMHSTKISGLAVDTGYTFHLVLRTSAGTRISEKVSVRTHKMTDLSGITITTGILPAAAREKLALAVDRIGAKMADSVRIDTTHFVTTEGRGPAWEKAVESNIPVVRPEWVAACETNGRILGVTKFYLDAMRAGPPTEEHVVPPAPPPKAPPVVPPKDEEHEVALRPKDGATNGTTTTTTGSGTGETASKLPDAASFQEVEL
ncbi:hypothetical protein CP533_6838 [Ophiocordyceps camponoti-saundersi (nom. inval.)]|nr:hypothetical protein CP533_6838 [Ophiocordyceps camponoti-saundersi (nom. inval.)]